MISVLYAKMYLRNLISTSSSVTISKITCHDVEFVHLDNPQVIVHKMVQLNEKKHHVWNYVRRIMFCVLK